MKKTCYLEIRKLHKTIIPVFNKVDKLDALYAAVVLL